MSRQPEKDIKDMELKELTEKTCALFKVESPGQLKNVLIDSCHDEKILAAFVELVDGNLSQDWMQKIYQYYLADRSEKKQDYTPACLASFMGKLAGDSKEIVDLCAGSGALIIQKWKQNPDTRFEAIELDDNVIPFLIFNMVVRNISCRVIKMDAIRDDKAEHTWYIQKGERFGKVIDL